MFNFLFQVFFVIRLHSAQAALNLPPIHDPDPIFSCDLMDGRDALLTLARDKHYEFSSLRRAKFSSIALLYELHNQGKESFVYNCNKCDTQVETRWHCTVCDVSTHIFIKKHFQREIVNIFLPIIFSIRVLGAQKKRLIEKVLLSTHNICCS